MFFVAICRNSIGGIQQARVGKVTGRNPLKGEARAARLACLLAECFGGISLSIVGDCLELVNQVHLRGGTPDWEISGEVETIRKLLEEHSEWSFIWTPREGNYAAHNLARWCTNHDISGHICVDDLPDIPSLPSASVVMLWLF